MSNDRFCGCGPKAHVSQDPYVQLRCEQRVGKRSRALCHPGPVGGPNPSVQQIATGSDRVSPDAIPDVPLRLTRREQIIWNPTRPIIAFLRPDAIRRFPIAIRTGGSPDAIKTLSPMRPYLDVFPTRPASCPPPRRDPSFDAPTRSIVSPDAIILRSAAVRLPPPQHPSPTRSA